MRTVFISLLIALSIGCDGGEQSPQANGTPSERLASNGAQENGQSDEGIFEVMKDLFLRGAEAIGTPQPGQKATKNGLQMGPMLTTHSAGIPTGDGISGRIEIKPSGSRAKQLEVSFSSSYVVEEYNSYYSCALEGTGNWVGEDGIAISGLKTDDCEWNIVYQDDKFFPSPKAGSSEACSHFCGGLGQLTIDTVLFSLPAAATQTGTADKAIHDVIILGSKRELVDVYGTMNTVIDDPVDTIDVEYGPVIKKVPPGTTGELVGSVYAYLETFGGEIKFSDGTTGFVESHALARRSTVKNVRADDTLNVRSDRSHRSRKITELPPNGLVWVSWEGSEDARGCELMTGPDRWWRVRTPNGIEGYVNCGFVE